MPCKARNKQTDMTDTQTLCREAEDLIARNDFWGAREKCAEALALDGENGEVLHLFGQVEQKLNFSGHAEELLLKAVHGNPQEAAYLYSLGLAYREGGRFFEARNAFAGALILRKDFAEAWGYLAMTMLALQEPAHEVEQVAYTALRLKPGLDAALRTLAELRGLQGRAMEQASLLEQLARQKPDDAGKLLAMAGLALAREHNYLQAAALLGEAMQLHPDDGEFAKAYAESLGEAGYPVKAREAFAHAAAKANGRSIWRYKHLSYCPDFFADSTQVDAYWDWLNAELDAALQQQPIFDLASLAASGFAASFNITHLWRNPKPVLQKIAKLFAPSLPFERPEPTQRLQKSGRIRVGFFIAPGHEATFIRSSAPLVMGMNPERFERALFYPAGAWQMFAGLEGRNIAHAPYQASFVEAGKLVREAECDIVYHWKAGESPWSLYVPLMLPAPVQCTSWGTHGTSGIAGIDHYVSWDLAEAEDAAGQYSENLFRLPCPPLVRQAPIRHAATRAGLGLPTAGTLYFCPHRLAKYHPEFDLYLKAILAEDAEAHILVLLHGSLPAREQVRLRMTNTVGSTAARRLLFLPRCTAERFEAFMTAADIVLASPSYDCSLSGLDALSRGCPVVAQIGPYQFNRYSAAFYWSMRIDNAPLADTMQGYVQAALDLSRNKERRHELGAQLQERSGLFTDGQGIIREWEKFFEQSVR